MKFMADAQARKLNEATLYKYRLLFRQLDGFAETHKLQFLKQLDLDTLAIFRAAWKDGPRSSLKKLERLRAFLRFTEERKWIDNNPATELKAPKVPNKPTMPFTREEMIRILTALEPYGKSAGIRNVQLCLSKISKCLSAWELVFLHNSRRCSFFSRHSSHLWPRSSGRGLPSGSRTWLYAIKSACSTGLQESAQN